MLVVGVFLGSLDTASNSLVVYMLGPASAPPLTQSLHAMVALGFVLGSLLIRPFLPDTGDTGDTGEVCGHYLDTANTSNTSLTTNTSNTMDTVMEAGQLPDLVSPFTIIFLIHAISAAAYLSLSKAIGIGFRIIEFFATLSYFTNHHLLFPVCCGFTMPTYQTVSQEEVDGDSSSATSSSIQSNKHSSYKSKLIYILAFFYFTFSCGMESFFQSQTFTFGICGPHQLKPKEVRLLTCSSISY